MKRYKIATVIVLILVVGISICFRIKEKRTSSYKIYHREIIKDTTIDCIKTGEFAEDGIYKRIYRTYNYQYNDSNCYVEYIDTFIQKEYYINEFNDTLSIIYRDVSEYPHREE